ncbi:MAG TPA: DUF2141 domain-containing protein [Allosphingosinicella sp.]|nr:DUF2141 domain-containing protein [Allosphingosinicella sp.]
MAQFRFAFGVALAALPLAASASSAPVNVTVRLLDVASGRGQLLVSLCDKSTFMKRCAKSARTVAKRGGAVVIFRGVRPGRYAVMAFHDENNDGRLGRTSIGIPSEGYGFSRDAKGKAGPPAFEQAAVNVPPAGAVVNIHLTY